MNTQDILQKWLNNEATPKDLELLNAMPEFELYRKIDTHVKRIEVPTHGVNKSLEALKNEPKFYAKKAKNKGIFTLNAFIKIAAIMALLVMSYVYVASLPTTIKAPLAGLEKVTLPDASIVTLQQNASIEYKKYGWTFDREVILNGEAYFDVAKGEKFKVITPKGIIQVLGTQFNVSTKNDMLVVTCYEGLVAVTAQGNTIKVTPGESYSFGEAITNSKVYTIQPSWIENESNFKEVSLNTVLMEIENQYKVTITTKNIDVNLRYTGSFTHNNLNEALQTITLPLNLLYSIDSNNEVQIFNNKMD